MPLATPDPLIPAELRQPPPRHVRATGQSMFRFRRTLFMVILEATALVGLILCVLDAFMLRAPTVPGVVQHIRRHEDSKHNRSWTMQYTYELPGAAGKQSLQDKISEAEAYRYHRGGPVRVHVWRLGSWHYALIDRSFGELAGVRLFPWLEAGWCSVIFGFFLILLWRKSNLRRQLVRRGTPVVGRIIDKTITRVRYTNYYVNYNFAALEAPAQPLSGEMIVTRDQYNAAVVGQNAVVLYDPGRPNRNALYVFTGFSAV